MKKILENIDAGIWDGKSNAERAKRMEDLLEAALPLIEWINENCHPHHKIIVDHTSVELLEGQCANITEQFLRD